MNAITGQEELWLAKARHLAALFAEDAVANDQAGGQPLDQLRLLKDSGLLSIGIPAAYGGQGASWASVLKVERELAKGDGSIAHLFGYHYNFIHLLLQKATLAQRDYWLTASAAEQWLWGNSVNSFSRSLFGRKEGEWWILNGKRPFSSGSHVADALVIAWEDEATNERFFAAIRPPRDGLTIRHDWDGIGQRQTGSGTVAYEDVRVHENEILPEKQHETTAFGSLGALQQQSVLLNIFIGQAWGALEAARAYTLDESRPWIYSGYERHQDDPWVRRTYGDLVLRLQAAELLADAALKALADAWARGPALTGDERGAAAVAVAAANALAGEVALLISEKIFEVMGARSATRANGFDRFWRNIRTHTLHNPAAYKVLTVGDWFLTGAYPEPGIFR